MRYSGKSLVVLVVLFALSMLAAWFLYGQLQSVAEGEWGGFTLGGAAAVFVAVFLLLRATYERTLGKNVVQVLVGFGDDPLPVEAGSARCSYTLFNRETLKETAEREVQLLKEGAGLVCYVESNSPHDLIQVSLEAQNGTRWRSAYHGLHVTPVKMDPDGA